MEQGDTELETNKVERKDVDAAEEFKVSSPLEDERPTPTYKVMAITIRSRYAWVGTLVMFVCTRQPLLHRLVKIQHVLKKNSKKDTLLYVHVVSNLF